MMLLAADDIILLQEMLRTEDLDFGTKSLGGDLVLKPRTLGGTKDRRTRNYAERN